MGIVLALLAAFGGVAALLWRLESGSRAARETIGLADDARGFFRRLAWSKRANRNPLDLVEDPREAAAAMMVLVATFDGALSAAEEAAILKEIVATFGMPTNDAGELLARGRWLTKDGGDLGTSLTRLSRIVEAKLSRTERAQLIAMLGRVALADGRESQALDQSISELERKLLPPLH